jgi:hypothetical protein
MSSAANRTAIADLFATHRTNILVCTVCGGGYDKGDNARQPHFNCPASPDPGGADVVLSCTLLTVADFELVTSVNNKAA